MIRSVNGCSAEWAISRNAGVVLDHQHVVVAVRAIRTQRHGKPQHHGRARAGLAGSA